MFEKKSYIFNDELGVCIVDNITQLSTDRSEPVSYYVLRPVSNKSKVSYIPVKNHKVGLRELITKEEALHRKEELKEKDSPLLIQEIEFVLSK